MDCNFEYYRVFYYVVKYRNFTKAAQHLMNNQPNVTRMIRNLEQELGCSLFIRSNRGAALTPEGEKLYAHVKIAVEQIQAGEKELQQLISLQQGTISIGASEVALRCFLLPVLKEYQKYYPHVRLKVSNHSTPQAVSALQAGAVDIAFVTTPVGSWDLQVVPLKQIREVPVCGPAFSFLAGKKLTLRDLTEYPIVSLGEDTRTYSFYQELFQKSGLTFSPDIEAATADQIIPMVKNNLGIGFVPEEFLSGEEAGEMYRLNLTSALPKRSICCIELPEKPLSTAAAELKTMILARREARLPG